jgi:hypothetical protein
MDICFSILQRRMVIDSSSESEIQKDMRWWTFLPILHDLHVFVKRKVRTWKWWEPLSFLRIFYLIFSFCFCFSMCLFTFLLKFILSFPHLLRVFRTMTFGYICIFLAFISAPLPLHSASIPTFFPIPRCFGYFISFIVSWLQFFLFPFLRHSHIFLFSLFRLIFSPLFEQLKLYL